MDTNAYVLKKTDGDAEVLQVTQPDQPSDVSKALEKVLHHVGDMGIYQILLFIAMLPFGFCWAFVYFGQMFLTATPQEHWCFVPELGALEAEVRRNLSIPATNGGYDHCQMYDANWTDVLQSMTPPDPSTPIVSCQNGWEFLYEDIPYATVVSERGWVCNRAIYGPLSQTINFSGSFFGGIVFGILADKIGRVPVLVLANVIGCIGGIGTMFTNSFWDFAICRFIVGISCDSCFHIIYILVMEYVGVSHRTWVANLSIAFYFGGGCLVLPWIALWINDWRYLSLYTSLPMLLVLPTPFLVPESTRWLISKGRIEKAVEILHRFERVNKRKIPPEVMDDFIHVVKTAEEPDEIKISQFLKTPSLRLIIICLICTFMAVALIFDGIIRLSESMGMDFFVTFTITSATEIPSILLLVFLLDRFGRRKLVCIPIMLAALIVFVAAFVPRGVATVTLGTIARFFTNMAFNTVIQWTPELMPTAIRASGSSFVHISASVALDFSPFIVFSERLWEGLPLIIMAVAGLLGGVIAMVLPETAGKTMPQTMEDLEILADSRPYRRRRKNASSSPATEMETKS